MLNKKTAVFPGTFDPFTIGHQSIVRRALNLFDEIIIAIGINESKRTYFSLEERVEMIQNLYKDHPQVRVEAYDYLTVDFAEKYQAQYILRGIRSVTDFEYEKTIADVNREISGVETVVLFTEPVYTHISSTIVRELMSFNKDVSEFVPDGLHMKEVIARRI
ncbi:MAG: pantetheine-phosphate adenylyltransferase [Bacteroidales bacterium]